MARTIKTHAMSILCCLMIAIAAITVLPKPASAQPERVCYCTGDTCTDNYNNFFKFCCQWSGGGSPPCGCTLFVTNCF
jgi:hypothetical protein